MNWPQFDERIPLVNSDLDSQNKPSGAFARLSSAPKATSCETGHWFGESGREVIFRDR